MPKPAKTADARYWAWAYDWPVTALDPDFILKPTHGMLAGQDMFVPYDGTSRNCVPSKAVPVKNVHLCRTRREAEDGYNAAVRRRIAELLGMAAAAQDTLVKTARDGFIGSTLADYPVMRPDLSLDYDGIVDAADPSIEIRNRPDGNIMDWDEFLRLLSSRMIDTQDGAADLIVSGRVCRNAVIDLDRRLIYVPDRYAIPFELVQDTFGCRTVQVLWFSD